MEAGEERGSQEEALIQGAGEWGPPLMCPTVTEGMREDPAFLRLKSPPTLEFLAK